MNRRNIATPLKALQTMYDLAMENLQANSDPKAEAACEKVRLHFGLKEWKSK